MGGGGARGEPQAPLKRQKPRWHPRNVGLESGRRARSLGHGYRLVRARTRFQTHLHDVSPSARACEPPTVPRAAPSGTQVRRKKKVTRDRFAPRTAERRRPDSRRVDAVATGGSARASRNRAWRRAYDVSTSHAERSPPFVPPAVPPPASRGTSLPASTAGLAPKKDSFNEPHVRPRCHRVAKSERESGVFDPFATLIGGDEKNAVRAKKSEGTVDSKFPHAGAFAHAGVRRARRLRRGDGRRAAVSCELSEGADIPRRALAPTDVMLSSRSVPRPPRGLRVDPSGRARRPARGDAGGARGPKPQQKERVAHCAQGEEGTSGRGRGGEAGGAAAPRLPPSAPARPHLGADLKQKSLAEILAEDAPMPILTPADVPDLRLGARTSGGGGLRRRRRRSPTAGRGPTRSPTSEAKRPRRRRRATRCAARCSPRRSPSSSSATRPTSWVWPGRRGQLDE